MSVSMPRHAPSSYQGTLRPSFWLCAASTGSEVVPESTDRVTS